MHRTRASLAVGSGGLAFWEFKDRCLFCALVGFSFFAMRLLLPLLLALLHVNPVKPDGIDRLPIVIAYTVVKAVCSKFGLPDYIKTSLEHNIFTQPDCEVILLTNLGECPQIADAVRNITGLTVVDSSPLTSARTRSFLNISANIFQTDNSNELWITSALRFFLLEDLMQSKGYKELLHVEADNLLYGRLQTVLPILRAHYPMAVTPLNTQKYFFTASVFWISQSSHLSRFNDFLLEIALNKHSRYDNYLTWIRPYTCCRSGGIKPDANGMGIKPFAINEMSMLAYYHELHPKTLGLLSGIPHNTYFSNRNIPSVNEFVPNGTEIASPTGIGIWDQGSWGQFLGGTANKRGRNKGFTDPTHIAGVAMRVSTCRPSMICGNMTEFDYVPGSAAATGEKRCYTAPFVSCGVGHPLVPLWNLHVHAKHTGDFKSFACKCNN